MPALLVMERALVRFPADDDLSVNFKPGIRFYFRYDELVKHPERVFDGVLPMKVKGINICVAEEAWLHE